VRLCAEGNQQGGRRDRIDTQTKHQPLEGVAPLVHVHTASPGSPVGFAIRRACFQAGVGGVLLIMVRSMTTSLCALIPCSRFGRI
jgi:hypothetical protein